MHPERYLGLLLTSSALTDGQQWSRLGLFNTSIRPREDILEVSPLFLEAGQVLNAVDVFATRLYEHSYTG